MYLYSSEVINGTLYATSLTKSPFMHVELVTKAVKALGYGIKKEDYPYTTTLTFSRVLWDRYLNEIETWALSKKIKLPEGFKTQTTAEWSNQTKTVVLSLVLGEHTSPALEEAMYVTLTKVTQELTKKLDEASAITLPKPVARLSSQSYSYASELVS